ncbi:MAG: hypothetical protein ACI9IP_002080 [Arcticibacterium sp.]|jgi:hypothetical protein
MQEHLNNLKEIRSLMEKSSKFISLSGLSGVFAGLVALGAASVLFAKRGGLNTSTTVFLDIPFLETSSLSFILLLALVTLVLAIAGGLFFTWRKTIKASQPFWSPMSKKLAVSLSIPLIVGAIFCLALMKSGAIQLVPEATLIFYGLALVNASQHTYRDVYYLGLSEIGLGLGALFVTGYTLLFWAFGFGVLHIVYGISMYYKYDRPSV